MCSTPPRTHTAYRYCKLVDFGFAKKLERTRKGSDLAKTFSVVGTPEYMAPELSKSGYAAV